MTATMMKGALPGRGGGARLRRPQRCCAAFATAWGSEPPYEDAALRWARAHPRLAEQCLQVPPDRDCTAAVTAADEKEALSDSPLQQHCTLGGDVLLRSFEDYWRRRGWRFPAALPPRDAPLGRRLATHVLSAPLTLAAQLLWSPLPWSVRLEPTVQEGSAQEPPRCHRWCCLGARAEASLPLEYWRELLVVVASWMPNKGALSHLSIDFVGPEIGGVGRRPPVTLQYRASSLTLTWAVPRKFHDLPSTEPVVPYDAYILLNPGLGHPHLVQDWRPTLERLVESGAGATMLLTAHSARDARRDAAVLSRHFGNGDDGGALYSPNAFASRIVYRDPFDASHMVQPNHYVATMPLLSPTRRDT